MVFNTGDADVDVDGKLMKDLLILSFGAIREDTEDLIADTAVRCIVKALNMILVDADNVDESV